MQTCCTRVARAVQKHGEENRKRTSRKHTCHKLKLTVMSRGTEKYRPRWRLHLSRPAREDDQVEEGVLA